MTYEEGFAYINQVQKRGSVLGLKTILRLLEYVGEPQNRLKVIHVAGTNGKGSICTFLEAMYRFEGKKVGRYISPTIHSYLERFQIDGIYMQEETFADILEGLKPVIEKMEREDGLSPTAFEIETVIAFIYFLEQEVDLVILETGMGGREDATNVIAKPMCTVFSEIGMDHMQFLGDTKEKITKEKAGIMRDGVRAVSYPNTQEVCQVLYEEASLHNTSLKVVDLEDLIIEQETLAGSSFTYKGKSYQIAMSGRFQIYNAITAIETKLLLDGSVCEEACKHAKWEGRFEKISENPLFIRDGAHNMDGVYALKESIEKHFTNKKLIFIIGVLKDKEHRKMMEILCPMASDIYTVTPENERGMQAEALKNEILPFCKKVLSTCSVKEAVKRAKEDWKQYEDKEEKAVIIAWGSLSYIGQITE